MYAHRLKQRVAREPLNASVGTIAIVLLLGQLMPSLKDRVATQESDLSQLASGVKKGRPFVYPRQIGSLTIINGEVDEGRVLLRTNYTSGGDVGIVWLDGLPLVSQYGTRDSRLNAQWALRSNSPE